MTVERTDSLNSRISSAAFSTDSFTCSIKDMRPSEFIEVDENGRYNGDWFNIADYNRITGNIEALHALAQELYPGFSIVSMPDQTVSDFPYASIINNIENNLDSIVNSTWKPPDYPGKKTWYANGSTPTVDDLNRHFLQ